MNKTLFYLKHEGCTHPTTYLERNYILRYYKGGYILVSSLCFFLNISFNNKRNAIDICIVLSNSRIRLKKELPNIHQQNWKFIYHEVSELKISISNVLKY